MLLLPLSPVSADLLPSRPRLLLPANLSLGLFLCGERERRAEISCTSGSASLGRDVGWCILGLRS